MIQGLAESSLRLWANLDRIQDMHCMLESRIQAPYLIFGVVSYFFEFVDDMLIQGSRNESQGLILIAYLEPV